jgi:hypothetical protein
VLLVLRGYSHGTCNLNTTFENVVVDRFCLCPKVEKVEALRQAQLDLLLGKVTPEGGAGGRGVSVDDTASEAPKGYAHPYYWAPFVLMGNWK